METTNPRDGGPGRMRVQQVSLALCAHLDRILARARASRTLHDQLRRAAESAALNIAEGAGHMTAGSKVQHYRIAHASIRECIAALDRIAQLNPHIDCRPARNTAQTVSKMLLSLIRVWEKRNNEPE